MASYANYRKIIFNNGCDNGHYDNCFGVMPKKIEAVFKHRPGHARFIFS
jgi:hypothetical protein